jgi:hypothetical protein
MFQFALYRALRCAESDVFLEIDDYDANNQRTFELADAFGLAFKRFRLPPIVRLVRATGRSLAELLGKSAGFLQIERLCRKLSWLFLLPLKASLTTINDRHKVCLQDLPRDRKLLFDGYWQSSSYFSGIEEELRKAFGFRIPADPALIRIRDLVIGSESVSLHFRRGDYIENEKYRQIYGGICTESYYRNAIAYISARVADPKFFIFSDDIEWAKQSALVSALDRCEIVSTAGSPSWTDMFLMSRCKHNIIANSSYSWWAAWLNASPNKITVAPSRWVNPGQEWRLSDLSGIFEKDWVLLEG